MEMWDDYGIPSYSRSEYSKNQKNVKVGDKIIVLKPDYVSREVNHVKSGDVAKVVEVGSYHVLAYNPKWNNFDRSDDNDYKFNGFATLLVEREYEVLPP